MALQVDYLSKIPQFSGLTVTTKPALQIRARHLANSQATDWTAAKTSVITSFENGRPGKIELHNQALAFVRNDAKNSESKNDFVTKLGDKLETPSSSKTERCQFHENLQTVWMPEPKPFDRSGSVVFHNDDELTGAELEKKLAQAETSDKTPGKRKADDDDRRVELDKALRWTVHITSSI